ncbi:Ferripyoverdine receptor [Thalassocella blandensis]|nr:Ferripyoverdine receptor [Thalassocella blandensis]
MKSLIPGLALMTCCFPPAFAQSNTAADDKTITDEKLETVFVYGEPGRTDTATKLNLSVLETPQTVSVISLAQIEDFSLREVNDLLDYVPGVTVERVETDRTYYTARGFDIVNFQYDGVGVPFAFGLTQGQQDTVVYEQVEVVKGASGLITGLANPSATINFIRKRPTDELQASAAGMVGEWNRYRVQGDVSSPITDNINARVVVSKESGDSYMDRYHEDQTVFYGIVAAELNEHASLTIGHSSNNSESEGASSGALPLFYSDGSLTDYPVSSNTATDWAFYNTDQAQTFIEYAHNFNSNWTFKAIYTLNDKDQEAETFYLSGAPDRETELGLVAIASEYTAEDKQKIADIFVSGSFSLGGREHELVIGANSADITLTGLSVYTSEWSGYDDPVGSDWLQGNTPRPVYDINFPATSSTDIDQTQDSFYLSSRLNPTDKLSVLLGARNMKLDQDGLSYGSTQDVSESETVPYLGLTYRVVDNTMLYASYSEVFKAQTWVDENLNPLGPVKGESTEFGIKREIHDGRAVVTLAAFESRHENFGEYIGRDMDTQLALYRGTEVESQGYELEVSGEIYEGLNLSAGYTHLSIEDENGVDTRTFIPTSQFKLALAHQLAALPSLRVGGGINWQNEIYVGDIEVEGSYALVDLFASYTLSDKIQVSFNVNNATDEKYLNSPQWGQANYGAPRNVQAAVNWKY